MVIHKYQTSCLYKLTFNESIFSLIELYIIWVTFMSPQTQMTPLCRHILYGVVGAHVGVLMGI